MQYGRAYMGAHMIITTTSFSSGGFNSRVPTYEKGIEQSMDGMMCVCYIYYRFLAHTTHTLHTHGYGCTPRTPLHARAHIFTHTHTRTVAGRWYALVMIFAHTPI